MIYLGVYITGLPVRNGIKEIRSFSLSANFHRRAYWLTDAMRRTGSLFAARCSFAPKVILLHELRRRISHTRPGHIRICHYHIRLDSRLDWPSSKVLGLVQARLWPDFIGTSCSIERGRQWTTHLPCTKTTQQAYPHGAHRQLLRPNIRGRALILPMATLLPLRPLIALSRAAQAMPLRIRWVQKHTTGYRALLGLIF